MCVVDDPARTVHSPGVATLCWKTQPSLAGLAVTERACIHTSVECCHNSDQAIILNLILILINLIIIIFSQFYICTEVEMLND